MYRSILAAVNEYTNSEIAARYALALAGSCKAKLFLTFVAEERTERNVLKRAEATLERLFLEAKDSGIEVESTIAEGDPVKRISEKVKESGIDIAFISTRREDVKKRFFVKTYARKLILKLPCSVAMVRVVHMQNIHPRHILVPLGGAMSRMEERAYFVAMLAKAFGSSVTLFHSAKPFTRLIHSEMKLKSAPGGGKVQEDIQKFSDSLRMHSIPHDERMEYGRVSRAITIEAAHRRNDLIVMGSSERSLVSSIVSENPVERVLRETLCNLIVFRPGHGRR